MSTLLHTDMVILILMCALATFATRIGGYVLMARMKSIPPRLDAALNAVPAAVLTTLVAPAFYAGEIDIKIAMAVALVVSLRFSVMPMLLAGWCVVMVFRHLL